MIQKINYNNLPFAQMDNINHYISACEKLGLRSSDLFAAPDLWEEKNINIVSSEETNGKQSM